MPGAELTIRLEDGKLVAAATGAWPVAEIEKGQSAALRPFSRSEFAIDSAEHTRLAFLGDQAGKVSSVGVSQRVPPAARRSGTGHFLYSSPRVLLPQTGLP